LILDVDIDQTNFPDHIFRNYVLENCDKDKDGMLSKEEIIGVKTIYVSLDGGIADLKGVGYFVALTELECYGNHFTSLDVSKNTMLTYLGYSSNQLTTLDVSKNTALTSLS
jgi:Leucine-rich repeat (LRR) protein